MPRISDRNQISNYRLKNLERKEMNLEEDENGNELEKEQDEGCSRVQGKVGKQV